MEVQNFAERKKEEIQFYLTQDTIQKQTPGPRSATNT